MAPIVVTCGFLALAALAAGCGETSDRIEAVDALPQSGPQSQGVASTPGDWESGGGEATRRSSEGTDGILEYGLFGPVLPVSENDTYESDCRFQDDPYETCL